MPIVFIGFGDQFYFLVFIDIYKKFRGGNAQKNKSKNIPVTEHNSRSSSH